MGPRRITKEEKVRRFWMRVVKTERGCWDWSGAVDKDGYAIFPCRIQFGTIRANRISYMIHAGDIPEGLQVLHTCDNPRCVNPHHLWLGTINDNTQDRVRKGRSRWLVGSENPVSKLTESQIRQIKSRYARTAENNQTALAREYGVDQAQISRILSGKAWVHV